MSRNSDYYNNILEILKRENIYQSQDFMSVFKKFKCKPNDIINFITFFLKSNNYIHFDEKTEYNERYFRKQNIYFKNFLITLVAFRHEAAFIDSIQLNHSKFLPDIDNVDAFVEEIKVKIKRIKDKTIPEVPSLNEPTDIQFSQLDEFLQYCDPFY